MLGTPARTSSPGTSSTSTASTAKAGPWNSFLEGKLDVAAFTAALQKITDKVYNDSSVKKVVVK